MVEPMSESCVNCAFGWVVEHTTGGTGALGLSDTTATIPSGPTSVPKGCSLAPAGLLLLSAKPDSLQLLVHFEHFWGRWAVNPSN